MSNADLVIQIANELKEYGMVDFGEVAHEFAKATGQLVQLRVGQHKTFLPELGAWVTGVLESRF